MFRIFQGRSSTRDSQTDQAREERLAAFVGAMIREIEQEKEGLRQRYERAGVEAALCFGTLEGERNAAAEERLKGLEAAMIYCEERSARLDAQAARFRHVLQTASEPQAHSS